MLQLIIMTRTYYLDINRGTHCLLHFFFFFSHNFCSYFIFIYFFYFFFHFYFYSSFIQRILDRVILTTMNESLNEINNNNSNSNNNSSSSSNSNSGNGNNNCSSSKNNISQTDNNHSNPTALSMQQNNIIDQISINCKINAKINKNFDDDNADNIFYLEAELMSSILQLSLLDVNMKKLPDGKYVLDYFDSFLTMDDDFSFFFFFFSGNYWSYALFLFPHFISFFFPLILVEVSWTLMVTTGNHHDQTQVGKYACVTSRSNVIEMNRYYIIILRFKYFAY